MIRPWLAVAICLSLSGCIFPRVRATKNPCDADDGIRYYRPKPYLLISPMRNDKQSEGQPLDTFVQMQLQYLPDFSEEYSLHVTPGLGAADVSITLDQGWNLTAINQDLDSNVDENIRAIGSLAGELGSAFSPTKAETTSGATMVVRATNVPLGYYESVVGCGSDGKKQMFGWRYVGFAPFNACPTAIAGGVTVCCDSPGAAIYGLVFEDGVMVFKDLHAAREAYDTDRTEPADLVAPRPGRTPAPRPAVFDAHETLGAIKAYVQRHELLRSELGSYTVTVQPSWDRLDTLRITITTTSVPTEDQQEHFRTTLGNDSALLGLLRDVSPTTLMEVVFAGPRE